MAAHVTHGMSKTSTYHIWSSMKARCSNPNHQNYHRYGGRGVSVCSEWADSFEQFLEDMGERPKGMSLDRIDVNGNYSADNCRWATAKQQMRNTSVNRIFTYRGETKTLTDWAECSGISLQTLCARLDRWGWSFEDAISKPINSTKAKAGEKNSMAKYTADTVAKVKAALAFGVKGREVAAMFDMPEKTVSLIKTGRRWASVGAAQ